MEPHHHMPVQAHSSSILTKSFTWMMLGLLISAVSAFIVLISPSFLEFIFGTNYAFFILLLAQLALVWYVSAQITKIDVSTAQLLFVIYSIGSGITLSVIFVAFDLVSILGIFVGAIAMFGTFAIAGKKTTHDMKSWGTYLLPALVGLIVASLVNLFVGNSALDLIVGAVGIVLFAGFTAYDVQRIKVFGEQAHTEEDISKFAIIGALNLYLDFINLFLSLLRVFGRRR